MTSRIVVGRQSWTTNRRMAQNCVITKSALYFFTVLCRGFFYKTKTNYKKVKKSQNLPSWIYVKK